MIKMIKNIIEDYKMKMKYNKIEKQTQSEKDRLENNCRHLADVLGEIRYLKDKKESEDMIFAHKMKHLEDKKILLEKAIESQKLSYNKLYADKLNVSLENEKIYENDIEKA